MLVQDHTVDKQHDRTGTRLSVADTPRRGLNAAGCQFGLLAAHGPNLIGSGGQEIQSRLAALPGSLAKFFAVLADPSGTPKIQRCLAIGLFERGAEVAVAGKSEVERQTS